MSNSDFIKGFKIVAGVLFVLFALFFGLMLGGASVFYTASNNLTSKVSVSVALWSIGRDVFESLLVVLPALLLFYFVQRLLTSLAGNKEDRYWQKVDRNLTFSAFGGMLFTSLLGLISDSVQW